MLAAGVCAVVRPADVHGRGADCRRAGGVLSGGEVTLLIPVANCNKLPRQPMQAYSGDVDAALAEYRKRFGREAVKAYCYSNSMMRLTFVESET